MFAVPSASTADTDSMLQSLYWLPGAAQAPPDLNYFKVLCLEPSCGTSCAVDFQGTVLMLEVEFIPSVYIYSPTRGFQRVFQMACSSPTHSACRMLLLVAQLSCQQLYTLNLLGAKTT